MPNSESEDPELDFTDFMAKQKSQLAATSKTTEEKPEELPNPMAPAMVRGIIFFGVLLVLLGILIILYVKRPTNGHVLAPPGYKIIESKDTPPRLQKIQ